MEVNVPIPNFPPFKLRSSLIDKDPVIWEHLLNDYLVLFQKLLAILPQRAKDIPQYKLSTQTKTQLDLFLNTFLAESAEEANQVFSLGAINPNIRQNQHLLRLAVFNYIKKCNLVNLKIQGKSCWNFLRVYLSIADKYSQAKVNQSFITIPIIRKLVLGEFKSNLTGKSDDLSLIRSLQDHLGRLITEGKWKQDDDLTLYILLGQKTKKGLQQGSSQRQGPRRINKGNNSNSNSNSNNIGDFAEKFVNVHWIDILSEIYSNGEGLHAKSSVQITSLSLCSLTSAKVINLIKAFEVKTLSQLKTFHPLVAKIVLSKTFNDLNPDFKDLISFLRPKAKSRQTKTFDIGHISSIEALFPQLSQGQIKTILVNHADNVENAINELLEMENFDSIKEYEEKRPSNIVDFQINDTKVEVMFGKKEKRLDDIGNDLKKKTLAMLYDAQEDEPDDTYIENELTSGGKAETSMQEQVLFGLFKSNRTVLDRSQRNTPHRQELKRELKWTDEQIEGWARILEKSPARFRNLEERLVYIDGNLNVGSNKQRTKWSKNDGGGEDKRRGGRLPFVKDTSNFQSYMNKKKDQRNKEKQKANVGNHNRKVKSTNKQAN